MPESKRRKRKHPRRSTTQRLAAIDGQLIRIKACCDIDVTIGVPRINVKHDRKCSALTDKSTAGYQRRIDATLRIREALERQGFRSTVVVDTAGSDPILVVI